NDKNNIITDIIYQHPALKKYLTRPCRLRSIMPYEIYSALEPPRPMRTLHLFLVIFFDEMGAYRHTYHSLGGCYLSIGNLPFKLRKLLRNVMLLGFVPFGCTFDDFIRPFVRDLSRLQ